jgi:hypothetical protein
MLPPMADGPVQMQPVNDNADPARLAATGRFGPILVPCYLVVVEGVIREAQAVGEALDLHRVYLRAGNLEIVGVLPAPGPEVG